MNQYSIHPMVSLKLIEREVCINKEKIKKYEKRKIAIFAAGDYAQRFYKLLKNDLGIEVEYFIDNNEKYLDGRKVCNKQVMVKPWELDDNFKDNYFILIATKAQWVKEISIQLDDVDVPYMSSDAYVATTLFENIKKINKLLDDDYSRSAYLGLMWYWLTHEITLCQSSNNQYFDVPQFSSSFSDIIADVGAYVGDSAEEYVKRSIGNCKIYAFEADENNCPALNLRIERLKKEWRMKENDIVVIPAAVGAKDGEIFFKNMEISMGSLISNSGEKSVKMIKLDNYFKDKMFPTIIKADIEGAELDFLNGSENIIKEKKPKMAICIYHLPEDLVKIPEKVISFFNNYQFAVRTHSSDYNDTVLYCY